MLQRVHIVRTDANRLGKVFFGLFLQALALAAHAGVEFLTSGVIGFVPQFAGGDGEHRLGLHQSTGRNREHQTFPNAFVHGASILLCVVVGKNGSELYANCLCPWELCQFEK